jgi:hypothetical protein
VQISLGNQHLPSYTPIQSLHHSKVPEIKASSRKGKKTLLVRPTPLPDYPSLSSPCTELRNSNIHRGTLDLVCKHARSCCTWEVRTLTVCLVLVPHELDGWVYIRELLTLDLRCCEQMSATSATNPTMTGAQQ